MDASIKQHKRICPLCEACCGLEITTQGEQVISIKGNKADVLSHGYICPKAVALKDLHEDPDRIRTPLIKRDGQFVQATWQEAYELIAQKLPAILNMHERDAGAISLGNPNVHKMGLLLYTPRLVRALGSRNVFSASTLDQMPKQLSSGWMFGHWFSVPVPDIERTQFMLILGANPMASNGSLWTVPDFRHKARALLDRGGRMVVIDPRRTQTAQLAGEHHFIHPGTDVFLLLAMVNTLFARGLVDLKHLTPHVHGVEELKQAVAQFTPQAVAQRCGIDAPVIEQLTHDLAHASTAVVYGRIGTCTQSYGTLCSWLIDCINILTGNLDRAGGAMFPKAPAFAANTLGQSARGKGINTGRQHSRVSKAPEVFGELPINCLPEEILTPGAGQIKALITVASNPALSAPDAAQFTNALAHLEFMVSVDIYLNETTRHADVILPGRSPLYDSHYDVAFTQLAYRNAARLSAPVFEATAEQYAEWQVLTKLCGILQGADASADPVAIDAAYFEADIKRTAGGHAQAIIDATAHLHGPERLLEAGLRTGPYGDHFGQHPDGLSLEKLNAHPDGIDLGALQPRIPELLRTPSGMLELAPQPLLDDLARAAADLSATRTRPTWTLIGRREVRSNNSWMHNLPTLAKGPMLCTTLIHPEDARTLGLTDGDNARISNGAHSIHAQIELSDTMMRGVISLPHGFGHDQPGTNMQLAQQRPGANINAMMHLHERDPLSGTAVLSGVAVQIERA